ncbi:hypothetical protein JCM19232_2689 [Vibrio ishigakensis]|uniref:Uncharacterized protein n=1 Tax=Vibrio ishigakensis TaxID=1481914 RepID=A0A0B8PLZ4_9VIBR|nr:hypothetical protein JCM19232_2689 [Vibrio ishigakensis]
MLLFIHDSLLITAKRIACSLVKTGTDNRTAPFGGNTLK